MPLVYDFKDIASRMKGEAKPKIEPKVEPLPCNWPLPTSICKPCRGTGMGILNVSVCKYCNGSGAIA